MSERPSAHGGLLHEELQRLGVAAESVLDVSVNVNPYGPCEPVLAAVRSASVERYPDPNAAPARIALGRFLDVSTERIVIGNGAVDLLWCLARALVPRGEAVVIVEPAFSELRRAAAHVGARIVEYRLGVESGFTFEPSVLDATLRAAKPALVYVCTPANPTGKTVPIPALIALSEAHPQTTFVVDLSFASLSEQHAERSIQGSERIVWLRSLTKDLALAGLRVGFAVAPYHLATALEAGRPPWSVNALAQAATVAATSGDAQAFVASSRLRLLEDRRALDSALRGLGLEPVPSKTLFSLVALGGERRATSLRNALLARHSVLVRDATSFGLPHHIRLCARPPVDTARLIRALARELNQ